MPTTTSTTTTRATENDSDRSTLTATALVKFGGQIVEVITGIAQQTNLLALNRP